VTPSGDQWSVPVVRLASRYRIDEVADDGVVRAEISPAVPDEVFAEHLAALVAEHRHLGVFRSATDDDGVVLEWERCRRCEKRACLKARIAGRCLDHDVPDHRLRDTSSSVQRGSRRAGCRSRLSPRAVTARLARPTKRPLPRRRGLPAGAGARRAAPRARHSRRAGSARCRHRGS
jgi:hypothetical protein